MNNITNENNLNLQELTDCLDTITYNVNKACTKLEQYIDSRDNNGVMNELNTKVIINKIDVNKCELRPYQKLHGMYPTLASKIVKGIPYNNVNDLLKIKGLTEVEKQLINKYEQSFTYNQEYIVDKINNGLYR